MTVVVRVVGDPMPKGSKTAIVRGTRAVLLDARRGKSRAAYAAWKTALEVAARAQYDGDPLDGPLHLTVTFWLLKPKSVKRTLPWARPDLDKLVRALDPLTGIVWADDARLVKISAQKFYAYDGQSPGCVIAVDTIDGGEQRT